ncbi:hypothetical protein [Leptospira wolffii]|uniref:hypothetical protein n=1 Tax=Leptospira wolffii TaxID=409998 RepID=UPI0002EA1A31|nr:hypothetical protein [Leptospira wolffii]EPG67953.1 hypothetical protein LEP1GSC061_0799 [Leptospira wolffii serovar Khorat str. Khorat-H2]
MKYLISQILIILTILFCLPSCGLSYLLFDEENGYLTEKKTDPKADLLHALLGISFPIGESFSVVFSSTNFTTPTWGPASYTIGLGQVPSSWTDQNFQFNVFIQVNCNNVVVSQINGVNGTSDSSQLFSPPYPSINVNVDGNTAGASCDSAGYCDIIHRVHNPSPPLLSEGLLLGTIRANFPATCSS